MEFALLQKLQDLNARIDTAPEGNPLANEAKKIKIKLDQMAELDSMNQEKYVIYIFSTFRKEVTTKDTQGKVRFLLGGGGVGRGFAGEGPS